MTRPGFNAAIGIGLQHELQEYTFTLHRQTYMTLQWQPMYQLLYLAMVQVAGI